jgi:uncharacterized membrane protein
LSAKEALVRIDPILLVAIVMLASICGALLTIIAYKANIARVVAQQLDEEAQRRNVLSRNLNFN